MGRGLGEAGAIVGKPTQADVVGRLHKDAPKAVVPGTVRGNRSQRKERQAGGGRGLEEQVEARPRVISRGGKPFPYERLTSQAHEREAGWNREEQAVKCHDGVRIHDVARKAVRKGQRHKGHRKGEKRHHGEPACKAVPANEQHAGPKVQNSKGSGDLERPFAGPTPRIPKIESVPG